VLKQDAKVNNDPVNLEEDVEIELCETPYLQVFNQESLIITKMKYEKKEDFGMLEQTKEELEEQEREEESMRELEEVDRKIKENNEI
jgi:hypothetical protein